MGGTSSTAQTQSSSLAPLAAGSSGIDGILGSLSSMAPGAASASPTQTGAINQIVSNSNGQPNYAPQISSGTFGLLNGGGANDNNAAITGNLGTLNSELGATANGSNIGANSALNGELSAINTGVTNQVNGQFAAAGRNGSPANSMALGMGIAQGDAPVIANQYNQDTANQLNAASTLYGAGNTTYGMLNSNQAAANSNFQNGIGAVSNGLTAENAAPNATLAAAAQQFGIPLSQLTSLLGAISPTAAQFGTQTGAANGTANMSGAQQFGLLAGGASNVAKTIFGS